MLVNREVEKKIGCVSFIKQNGTLHHVKKAFMLYF